jgi:hypothetical protein
LSSFSRFSQKLSRRVSAARKRASSPPRRASPEPDAPRNTIRPPRTPPPSRGGSLGLSPSIFSRMSL